MRAKMLKQGGFSPPNTWQVLIDGYRVVLADESYEVCAAVEHAINHPEAWEPTEAYEIAGAIEPAPALPRRAGAYRQPHERGGRGPL